MKEVKRRLKELDSGQVIIIWLIILVFVFVMFGAIASKFSFDRVERDLSNIEKVIKKCK